MRELRERIAVLAKTDPSVIIHISGPSGSGKELVAREIHRLNPKTRDSKFIAVDLSYVPRELAGSRLFGHEKGAFTGADTRRVGAFEEGAGGTVFLDEVSSIRLEFQGMFLRVLQEREFSPLGSVRQVRTQARIIAASNEDLWQKVQRREFRQDLYFRLQVLQIEVPGLGCRTEDIPELVEHFIGLHAARVGCPPDVEVTDEFLDCLQNRRWPGNVRQLENVVIQALAMASDKGRLTKKHAMGLMSEEEGGGYGPIAADLYEEPYPEAQRRALRDFKRAYWARKLRQNGGNISEAARSGGVLPSSLHRMLKDLEIDVAQTQQAEAEG